MTERRFQGATAIVTGGGTGIGRATALALAREGASVVVGNRNAENGQETVSAIEAMGGNALFVQTDVSKDADIRHLVDAALRRSGRIDLLINNAAIIGDLIPAAESTEENWDRVIDTNLKGPWLCMKHVIPHMVTQKSGVIVNVASAVTLRTFPSTSIYSASKAGLTALTRVAAVEYARMGLLIKSICVGGVRTPMTEGLRSAPDGEAFLAGLHPVNRVAEPEEIANAIVWLCSGEASFAIGAALHITGGMEIA
jgi:NAD(P)-dependent dehydrogenase (short-subunit alcohol dehydrogenase family)